MMHGMGFGGFGMGFPFLGLLPLILLGVGFYFLNRGRETRHPSPSPRQDRPGSNHPSARQTSNKAEMFRIAKEHGGVLTVSDVVAEIGVDPQEAESLLDSLADGNRVVLDVDNNGVVTYTFRELT